MLGRIGVRRMNRNLSDAVEIYDQAWEFVVSAGYVDEIDWQQSLDAAKFTETDLLRETAWVIFCSGFREATVRKYFDFLSLCFCDWESAFAILANEKACVQTAFSVFGNLRKLEAVVSVAGIINQGGFSSVRSSVLDDPINSLKQFPYIGDITSWHLAKNLGFQVAKPDRHLVRFSKKTGFVSPHALCEALASITGDAISVVDLVLWRYAASGARG